MDVMNQSRRDESKFLRIKLRKLFSRAVFAGLALPSDDVSLHGLLDDYLA